MNTARNFSVNDFKNNKAKGIYLFFVLYVVKLICAVLSFSGDVILHFLNFEGQEQPQKASFTIKIKVNQQQHSKQHINSSKKETLQRENTSINSMWRMCACLVARRHKIVNIVQTPDYKRNRFSCLSVNYHVAVARIQKDFVSLVCSVFSFT